MSRQPATFVARISRSACLGFLTGLGFLLCLLPARASEPTSVSVLPITIADLAYDSERDQFFGSITNANPDPSLRNTLARINPYTASVIDSTTLGNGTGMIYSLGISDDGSALYAETRDNVPFFRRSTLFRMDPSTLAVAASTYFPIYNFGEFVGNPVSPDTMIAIRYWQPISGSNFTPYLAILRTNEQSIEATITGPPVHRIIRTDDPNRFYTQFYHRIDEVTLDSDWSSVEGNMLPIDYEAYSSPFELFSSQFVYADDRFFFRNGTVIDVATLLPVGSLAFAESAKGVMLSDNKLYYVSDGAINIYDPTSLDLIDSLVIAGAGTGALHITRFGEHGIAYSSSAGLVLVTSPSIGVPELSSVTIIGMVLMLSIPWLLNKCR